MFIKDLSTEGEKIIETEEYTPTEAAKILGVSETQLRRVLDEGGMQYKSIGGELRIEGSNLAKYLRRVEELRAEMDWQASHIHDLKVEAITEL